MKKSSSSAQKLMSKEMLSQEEKCECGKPLSQCHCEGDRKEMRGCCGGGCCCH